MDVHDGFHIIKNIHYVFSTAFVLNALFIIIRSGIGIIKKLDYSNLDRFLSYAYIINLYLQLIFGLVLFLNLGSSAGYDYVSADGTVKMVSKRLWPIEHIVLMIFALLIANLGFILSNKAVKAKAKHKNVLIYYSIAIVLIAYSMASIYIF